MRNVGYPYDEANPQETVRTDRYVSGPVVFFYRNINLDR